MLKPGNYANMAAALMGLSKAAGESGGQDGGQDILFRYQIGEIWDALDPCVRAEMLERKIANMPDGPGSQLEFALAKAKSDCLKQQKKERERG